MLKFLVLVTIILVFGLGAPNLYAQTKDWKTYLNPIFKFTIQYPDTEFTNNYVEQEGNVTTLVLDGRGLYMNINIEPLNQSLSNDNTALKWIKNHYNREQNYDFFSVFQNITGTTYGGNPAYKMILYDPLGATYHYAYLQYENVMLVSYMLDSDTSSYDGKLFDQIVNTTKFFD